MLHMDKEICWQIIVSLEKDNEDLRTDLAQLIDDHCNLCTKHYSDYYTKPDCIHCIWQKENLKMERIS